VVEPFFFSGHCTLPTASFESGDVPQTPMTNRLRRWLFFQLYGGFAWTYDIVAGAVSLGHWREWVGTVVPYVTGTRVLELGHAPGYLQQLLRARPISFSIGVDPSPQMGTLARRRLKGQSGAMLNLTRAIAQHLPFRGETFETVVATFPTEFISDPLTLAEVRRVLRPGGRLVVLPRAWMGGRKVREGSAKRPLTTPQRLRSADHLFEERLGQALVGASLRPDFRKVELKSSTVQIIVAAK
jgi:SAM-dependent methyltransferase